jgi:hypothetical protein
VHQVVSDLDIIERSVEALTREGIAADYGNTGLHALGLPSEPPDGMAIAQ